MNQPRKSPPSNGRLGNFVLPDKEAVNSNLRQSQVNVNTKEDVEATMDIFFGLIPKMNLGVK